MLSAVQPSQEWVLPGYTCFLTQASYSQESQSPGTVTRMARRWPWRVGSGFPPCRTEGAWISCFSHCYGNIPDKKRLKAGRVYSSSRFAGIKSIMEERAQWRELNAAGHIAVRQLRKMNAGSWLAFSFL